MPTMVEMDNTPIQPELAGEMFAELREVAAWLRFYLPQTVHVPVVDERGYTVNSYAAVRIPDWAVKQRLAELDELIAKVVTK